MIILKFLATLVVFFIITAILVYDLGGSGRRMTFGDYIVVIIDLMFCKFLLALIW